MQCLEVTLEYSVLHVDFLLRLNTFIPDMCQQ